MLYDHPSPSASYQQGKRVCPCFKWNQWNKSIPFPFFAACFKIFSCWFIWPSHFFSCPFQYFISSSTPFTFSCISFFSSALVALRASSLSCSILYMRTHNRILLLAFAHHNSYYYYYAWSSCAQFF